ncbi:MAG: DNA repair protein RecN [Saccharofermentans sp.]|nr:DNA repair protein RecN [Saccharofermentans sp.]
MLIRLEINNFAVISESVFEPKKGLNVISGETGAGKSLLIDAIGLILGSKASKNLIRTGEDFAYVEAVFDISEVKDQNFYDILKDSGIDTEDDILVVSRKVSRDGKSIARVNSRTVVLSVLKAISAFLVNIHGQHDTQAIFDESSHVGLLDSFAGSDIEPYERSYQELLKKYKDIVIEMRNLSLQPGARDGRKEYLEYAIKEISEASLSNDEEESLTELNRRYKQMESDLTVLGEADELLNSEDGSGYTVADRIRTCASLMEKLALKDESYKDIAERLKTLAEESADLSSGVGDLASSSDYSKDKADEVTSRLGLIYDLKSKYGCKDVAEINAFCNNARDELSNMKDSSKRIAELRKIRSTVEGDLLKAAEELTDKRRIAAADLSSKITEQLRDLEIPRAEFDVAFKRRSKDRFFASHGIDDVIFMFTANPGEEPKVLSSTASGGEASRIMLAIKCILSDADMIPTLIFDEIDTGVSGKAAHSIAGKLKLISSKHQVLCVTHTAQIAAAADSNFLISKKVVDEKTISEVSLLDKEGKEKEVSRLLSGTDSSESVDLAKKLVEDFL